MREKEGARVKKIREGPGCARGDGALCSLYFELSFELALVTTLFFSLPPPAAYLVTLIHS